MLNSESVPLILSVTFLLFVLFSIPVLIQIWRTAKGMAETLKILDRDLPVIMRNLEQITTNINRTTTTIHREVAELSLTVKRVQGIVGVFFGLGEILRQQVSFPFARTIMTSLAVVKGVRAFVEVWTGGSSKETGGKGQSTR